MADCGVGCGEVMTESDENVEWLQSCGWTEDEDSGGDVGAVGDVDDEGGSELDSNGADGGDDGESDAAT